MKKFNVLIAVLVLLALAYTAFWFYNANDIKKKVTAQIQEFEKPDADGYQLKVDNVSVSGYPLNYEVVVHKPTYQLAESDKKEPKVFVDGDVKLGTDIFGRSYWFRRVGDIKYSGADAEHPEVQYVIKGTSEFKMDVNNPQYWKAFVHPFLGFPKVFYKENASLQDFLYEVRYASLSDKDFGLYEVNGQKEKQLIGFSKGNLNWKYNPKENEDKFELDVEVRDLEATNKGENLKPHIQQFLEANNDFAVDFPHLFNSGKNNIDIEFEGNIPRNIDYWDLASYKHAEVALKKFIIKNLYGDSSLNFALNVSQKSDEARKLHFDINSEASITEEGSAAIHKQFLEGLKQKAVSDGQDDDQKLIVELLKCCEDNLKGVIPDYSKLGKMQFAFDTDVNLESKEGNITDVSINKLDAISDPYAIKSHGEAELENGQVKGKYKIDWSNYQTMIHDLVAYFNRIHPLLVKIAENQNQAPISMDLIKNEQEKEIVDFFKSLSDNHALESKDIRITIDFNDPKNIKVGENSLENVVTAWDKLVADLTPKKATAGKSDPEAKEKEPSEKKEESKEIVPVIKKA